MPDSPVASLATIRATSKTISVPNATATAASGWVRRHSTQRATTMLTARAVSSQVRSGRSAASMSDAATATPSSAQSRHPVRVAVQDEVRSRAPGGCSPPSANLRAAVPCRSRISRKNRKNDPYQRPGRSSQKTDGTEQTPASSLRVPPCGPLGSRREMDRGCRDHRTPQTGRPPAGAMTGVDLGHREDRSGTAAFRSVHISRRHQEVHTTMPNRATHIVTQPTCCATGSCGVC